jgi:hypothetical protein
MDSLIMSFVTALTSEGPSDGNPGKVVIIVPRSRAYLADLLAQAFQGKEDVEIIVDRRYGDRRTLQGPAATERRWIDRRRPKERVIEVVVGTTKSEPESPPGAPPKATSVW